MSTTSAETPLPPAGARKKYVPAVGPRLKKLLFVVFGLVALLCANSAYLLSVKVLESITGKAYENYFYLFMFLGHLVLGLLLVLPVIIFGVLHMAVSRNRKNRRAVRIGYALFAVAIAVLVTGILLMRVGGFDLKHPATRATVYWLHFAAPLVAGWLYWLHRLAGPRIKWRIGLAFSALVGVAVLAMVLLHSQDPRKWYAVGPASGKQYFEPSLARTSTGNFIPADTLMMDTYCLKCHEDAYQGWFHSAHRFSSFSNPAYLASVRETREVALQRDGNVQASRWCAGCHDPVPFFSGAFDDRNFDLVGHPTAHAGITCTTCHAITNINSTKGNGDYTIEEPQHYPFAKSDNAILQFINNQLVKAKPNFHKKTFLKEFHKTAKFCSTCHKVNLPKEVTQYKEFLRGQNHYDPYLLSGVSGHGARSFYYPPKAVGNCAGCHMPTKESQDFGAKPFDEDGKLKIHHHLFPSANTGIAWFHDNQETIDAHQQFLQDKLRIDIFGLRENGEVDGKLIAPIRPSIPVLKPGEQYLLEAVVRTLKMGHLFTQGTTDSNEVWIDVTVTSGDRVIGRSGGIDEQGEVDRWSHFINVFMLDKDGNRINRRNAQDIFTPLYNHQIPPGAAQVAHYALKLPTDVREPVTVEVKLQYRKFDKEYMEIVTSKAKVGDDPIRGHEAGKPFGNPLPITTLCSDRVTFPVEGGPAVAAEPAVTRAVASATPAKPEFPLWQRWNDYGIGLYLEGTAAGQAKGELRQAAAAFAEVEKLKRFDGPLNLARVYFAEGRLDDAVEALSRVAAYNDTPAPPPAWTLAWMTGLVNRQQGHFEQAKSDFKSIVTNSCVSDQMRSLGFDFSMDYEVLNLLGATVFDLAKQVRGDERLEDREKLLREAVKWYQKTLDIDSENVEAHYNLQLLFGELGETAQADEHAMLHARYKSDDNARDRAVRLARERYPWADMAAESLVIYPLDRQGAPGLSADAQEKPGHAQESRSKQQGVAID